MGKLIYRQNNIDIWKTPMKNNDKKGWLGIFNRCDRGITINLTSNQLNLDHVWEAKDIWKDAVIPINKENRFIIPPDGVIFLSF